MTNRLCIAALMASFCFGSLPALAAPQPNSGLYTVNGLLASKCSLGTSSAPLTVNTTVDNNGKLDPAINGRSFTLTSVICTAPSTIAVKATALRITAPRTSLPTGQSQTANFTATAAGWSSAAATVRTAQTNPLGSTAIYTGTSRAQNLAKTGTVTVTVNNFTPVVGSTGKGWKLIDGSYLATITISLTPSS